MALDRNTKKAKKVCKPRKPHPVLNKVLAVVCVILSICIICGTVAFTYVYKFSKDYVEGDKKIDLDMYKANQAQTSIIYGYDANNDLIELLRLHGAENRVWIDYKDIPPHMVDAFRDLEDKRFNDHNGVDWIRSIFGVIASKFDEGGSTITQQLIKNVTGENGRNVSRKFYEILNALNVERFYSKKTIMEFYLNTVYLGNGCYGVKTAAEKYFGKNVEDLNAAECAVIACITKAPATYEPLSEPEENRARQKYCLKCMFEAGSLTKEEYEEALDFDLIFTNSENYKGSQVKKNKNDKEYTEDDIKYSDTHSKENSSYYVEYVIDNVIADLQQEYDLTYNEAWRKVFFGGLRIYSAVDLSVQEQAEKVFVNRETFPDEEDTKEKPAAQAAMTIMDYNGRVVAMVGGAGEKKDFRGLNRASDSPRQPGSAIKPLSVYAPAIDENIITWSTKVQNYGIKLGSSRWPVNYGGNPGSPNHFVTVQYALQQSYNTVPAQIMRKLGIKTSLDFLSKDLHFKHLITNPNDPNYDGNYSSLCVGGMRHGVTTLEMASAFAMFGNNGYYFKPYSYYKVTNNDGSEVLLESKDDPGERVIAESSAGVMRELLRTVVTRGTGSAYGVSGFPTFAKTGTTSDEKDRWFVGGTPYYVAAVWYGYDQPRPIYNTWGNPAGKLFKAVMNPAHEDLDDLSFPTASGVVARNYCTISGDIARSGCSKSTGYYRSNNIPHKCKSCNLTSAIGQGIPDVITNPNSTTAVSTTKKPNKPKPTKPTTTKASNTTVASNTTTKASNSETTITTVNGNGTTIANDVRARINQSFN